MVNYRELQRQPATSTLVNERITSMKDLNAMIKTGESAFIALDTEYIDANVREAPLLQQVGLAYSPTLSPQFATAIVGQPSLQHYYTQSQIQGLTLNILTKDEIRDKVVCSGARITPRRPSRFGRQENVELEDVESSILEFIEGFKPGKNLILVGFEMSSEWKFLTKHFPRITPYFSSWMDIRDIARDAVPDGTMTGLKQLLYCFGFDWRYIKPYIRGHNADHAGDDAVFTLAAASALFCPRNQERLRTRQTCSIPLDFYKIKQGFMVKGEIQHPFAVSIQSETGLLPKTMGTRGRLARYFLKDEPESVGWMNHGMACLTFKRQDRMDRFIRATDGCVLPTGETLCVRHMGDAARRSHEAEEEMAPKRKAKQLLRKEQNFKSVEYLEQDLGFGLIEEEFLMTLLC